MAENAQVWITILVRPGQSVHPISFLMVMPLRRCPQNHAASSRSLPTCTILAQIPVTLRGLHLNAQMRMLLGAS